jgi:hypothetical protein
VPYIWENIVDSLVPGVRHAAEADLPSTDCELGNDLMWGADEIAAFVSQLLGRKIPPKWIYRWRDKRLLPIGNQGARYVASKRRITAHFAAIANAPSAPPTTPARHSRRPQAVRRQARRGGKHQIRHDIADPIAVGSEAGIARWETLLNAGPI